MDKIYYLGQYFLIFRFQEQGNTFNSISSPFAYGDYDACLREGYLYSTVAIFGTPVNPLHFGFCHSN